MPSTEALRRNGTGATTSAPILVGFDGSEGAQDAYELGRLMSWVQGAPLEVHDAGSATPGTKLMDHAEEIGAATLVVGSPHRGRVGRALLGSVAEHVLHEAPCEVMVAPRGYSKLSHQGLRKVAVAFDGTPESRAALRRGEELARAAGATIELIVAEDPVVSGLEARLPPEILRSAADVLTAAVAAVDPALSPSGKRIDPGWRQVVRTIAKSLVDACGPDVDLLVAGTRRPLDRFLLGSVTKHLVTEASCPVLVVPRPE